jgi:hypothetical protein
MKSTDLSAQTPGTIGAADRSFAALRMTTGAVSGMEIIAAGTYQGLKKARDVPTCEKEAMEKLMRRCEKGLLRR